MSEQPKQINFTIVPDESEDVQRTKREYSNFCAVAHTPFDLTLTFCDVRPLSERDIKGAESSQTVRAPIVARIALPFSVAPGLITALQEQLRVFQESQSATNPTTWPKGSLH